MRPSIRRLVLLAGAVALTGLLAACGGTSSNTSPGMDDHGMQSSMSSASVAAGRAGDVTFAQMMIPHHQQAVEMAEIALGKTDASIQVRELATAIKQAQDPEIQTMAGWLKQWGAATPTSGMNHGGMGSGMMSDADMEALEQASGQAFDAKWVSMMIAHHEGAIDMARQVLASTEDPDVKTLADAIIKAQTEEITKMWAMS
jgi:uncharacterized protein (DUF305 family)